MNVLFLTNNIEVTRPLYDWLCVAEGNSNITLWESTLTPELFDAELRDIEFVISYNYRHIIKRGIIERFPGRIINLHISMLPWNRGASPNLWSFIDDTPKGVTIHLIDEGIDSGDILLQRQMFFDESEETFASSYSKLHTAIQALFCENWEALKLGRIRKRKQGSYHTVKETDEIMSRFSIDWSSKIMRIKTEIYGDSPVKWGGGGG